MKAKIKKKAGVLAVLARTEGAVQSARVFSTRTAVMDEEVYSIGFISSTAYFCPSPSTAFASKSSDALYLSER